MADKKNSRSRLVYNKGEWQRIANEFLLDPKAPSSALRSAFYALSGDDKELAEKCLEEAVLRQKRALQKPP